MAGYKFKLAALSATTAALFVLAACPFSDEEKSQIQIKKTVLANGLTVLLVEDHTVPVVSYQTWVKVGSVDEVPGGTGLAHLFEHLQFKGTPKFPNREIFNKLEARGAEVNAFTTRDYTVYYENFIPEVLDTVIELESDRLTHLELTPEVLNTERLVVLEERRLRLEGNPDGKLQEAIWERAYTRHPYAWPVIGYPQDLLTVTIEKVREFYSTHYQPNNTTVVVVGDIDAKLTLQKIRDAYGVIPRGPEHKRLVTREPEQREERRLTLHDPQVASDRIAIAYPITSAHEEDTYALDILANILFEGNASRGYRALVEDQELALGVGGTAYTPEHPGLFMVNATLKAAVPIAKAEAALDQLFERVVQNGVSDDEVKIAIRQLTVQLVDSVRTPQGLGQFIGTVETLFGDPNRFAQDLKKYTKVTAADVQAVAARYFGANRKTIVVLTK